MDRFEKTSPRPNQPVRARDIGNMPRETLSRLRNNSTTQISRYGENMLIKTKGGEGATFGNFSISTVKELPAIPTTGAKFVIWTSLDGGTGDNQIWATCAGATSWYPLFKYTTRSGIPST